MHIGIITFGYPPLAHVSAKRPVHMARELVKLGDRVSVITVDWREEAPAGAGSRGDPAWITASEDGVRVSRVNPRRHSPTFDPTRIPRTTEPPLPKSSVLRYGLLLHRTVTWGPYPSWAREALRALRAAHNERALDVIWAIHGDASSHEIALRFSRATGVPWIADFKDPWDLFSSWLARPVLRLVTKRRLKTATALTETCRAQSDADQSCFQLPASVIWSGYDDRAMEVATPNRVSDRYTLAYFGHVGPQHDIDRLPRALARLARDAPDLYRRINVDVYSGHGSALERAFLRFGCRERLSLHSYLSEQVAFAAMRAADALVLFPALNRASVGVKELEYLASGSTVLVLGELLAEIRNILPAHSQVHEAHDDDCTVRFLERDVPIATRAAKRPVNQPFVAEYSWARQAKRLRQVFQGVVSSGDESRCSTRS